MLLTRRKRLDRSTPIGQMIDSYLKGQAEIEDHVIHLLFSANRWEAAYVSIPIPALPLIILARRSP